MHQLQDIMKLFNLVLVCLASFITSVLSVPSDLSGHASARQSLHKRTQVVQIPGEVQSKNCTNITYHITSHQNIVSLDTVVIESAMVYRNLTYYVSHWNPDNSYAPLLGWRTATFGVKWTHREDAEVL